MKGSRSLAALAASVAAAAATACGSTATAGPNAGFHWWPTDTPGPAGQSVAQATATPQAQSASPSAASTGPGTGQSSGLGTPAQSVSATGDLKFDPATITVKVGDVIQWTNTGSAPHNVTFDGQDAITSGTLSQGDTWQVKFATAGTYAYHCTFHPGMNGQVTVGG